MKELSREMALDIVGVIENFDIELEAYRKFLATTKTLFPQFAATLDEQLSAARHNPDLFALTKQKYDPIRDMIYAEELIFRFSCHLGPL